MNTYQQIYIQRTNILVLIYLKLRLKQHHIEKPSVLRAHVLSLGKILFPISRHPPSKAVLYDYLLEYAVRHRLHGFLISLSFHYVGDLASRLRARYITSQTEQSDQVILSHVRIHVDQRVQIEGKNLRVLATQYLGRKSKLLFRFF